MHMQFHFQSFQCQNNYLNTPNRGEPGTPTHEKREKREKRGRKFLQSLYILAKSFKKPTCFDHTETNMCGVATPVYQLQPMDEDEAR